MKQWMQTGIFQPIVRDSSQISPSDRQIPTNFPSNFDEYLVTILFHSNFAVTSLSGQFMFRLSCYDPGEFAGQSTITPTFSSIKSSVSCHVCARSPIRYPSIFSSHHTPAIRVSIRVVRSLDDLFGRPIFRALGMSRDS
jgi:hypothetical protein